MHALRLLAPRLRARALHDDVQVRGELMLAAVLCGQGTDHTGAGIATVLGHAIGARYEADNGVVKAIVFPPTLRFNADAAKSGLEKIATSFGLPGSDGEPPVTRVIASIEAIFSELGIPRRLRDVRVPREALAGIAKSAMGDWFLRGNPRAVRGAEELQQILEASW
jgi:alcohol dehydrogenase class IV